MKAKEYREKPVEELKARAADLKVEMFNLRFQHFTGQLENSMRIRQIRREVGRVLTLIKEKELAPKTAK